MTLLYVLKNLLKNRPHGVPTVSQRTSTDLHVMGVGVHGVLGHAQFLVGEEKDFVHAPAQIPGPTLRVRCVKA